MKEPENTQPPISIIYICIFYIFHNDGHIEEKVLFWCKLTSYFVSLNLFSIIAVFLKHPVHKTVIHGSSLASSKHRV